MPSSTIAVERGTVDCTTATSDIERSSTQKPTRMDTEQYTTTADPLAIGRGICDLPFELVIHIFALYTPSSRIDIRMSHICRFLRAAIHAAPEFWVDMLALQDVIIQDAPADAFWRSFLPRTGSLPLTFSITVTEANTSGVLSSLPVEYCPRISSLTFDLRRPKPGVLRMLPVAALPGLTSMRCITNIETTWKNLRALNHLAQAEYTGTPFSSRLPNLRVLEIPFRFFRAEMIVPCLRTLVLGPGSFHIPSLLSALRGCPSLEILKLVGPSPKFVAHDDPIADLTVPLPCLREWIVKWGPTFLHHMMMRYIVPAPTTHFHFVRRGTNMRWPRNVFTETPLPSSLNNLDALSVHLHLIDDHSQRDLRVKGYAGDKERMDLLFQRARWSFDSPHRGPSDVMQYLTHVFGPIQSITSLRFDFERGVAVVEADWARLFEAFPRLRSLIVTIRSCRNIFRVIRKYPLLPSMEKLEISCWNGSAPHELMVLAIERRRSARFPLKQFTFRHLNETTRISAARLARLKAVVSEVIVS